LIGRPVAAAETSAKAVNVTLLPQGEREIAAVAGASGYVLRLGANGAVTRLADLEGNVLEYAIPWRLLNAADDPPRSGDVLAAAWQIHWSDESGRLWRDQMVEIRNRREPSRILVWERAATWGRAEFR